MIRAALGAFALLCAAPAAAQNAGVQVSPVVIALPHDRAMGAMRVRNGRTHEAIFEIEAFIWSQASGQDTLTPTRALIVAPSVFAIAPGASQTVRLALAPGAREPQRQQAFRIVLREIPPQSNAPTRGPRLVLEMSLPVFVTPPGAAPDLQMRRVIDASGAPFLSLANHGRAHAALSAAIVLPGETRLAGAPRYLLPGAEVRLPLTPEARAVRINYAAPGATSPTDQVIDLAQPAPVARLR